MKLMNLVFSLILTVLLLFGSLLIPLIPSISLEAATNWTKSDITIDNERYIIDSFVIKDGTIYKMWYTHIQSDLSIGQLYSALSVLNLYNLLDELQAYDFEGFFTGLSSLTPADLSNIKDIFDGISTVIGYATSTDGKSWTIQDSNVFSGYSDSIWTSIGLPSVVKVGVNDYRMWYTRIESTLTQAQLQNIFIDIGSSTLSVRKAAIEDLFDSTRTVIGYATSTDGYSDWVEKNPTAFAGSGGVYLLSSVSTPSVVADGTNYKLWYSCIKTGLNTTDLDSLLADVQSGAVDMSNIVNILSDASSVIGYATSSDGGQTFNPVNDKVLPDSSVPNPAVWQSIADPCVVKTSAGYEMWYMNGTTNLIQSTLRDAVNVVKGWGIPNLWNSLKTKTLGDFIDQDLKSINFTGLQTILSDTTGVIGNADSTDGIVWTIKSTNDLEGEQTTPWSSVGAPSIVKSSSKTEIWFSKGIPDLTWQNISDRVLGDNSGLGYASVSTGGGFFGGGGAEPSPISGIGGVCWPLTPSGYTTVNITLLSDDEMCEVYIPKTTKTLTEDLEELKCIYVSLIEPSPEGPEGKIVLVAYSLEPEGAHFNPSITLSIKYDPELIPEGIEESTLELAYLDPASGKWTNLDNFVVDIENHVISGKTEHFTPFGIISDKGVPAEIPTEPPEETPTLKPAVFVTSALTISPATVEIGGSVTIDIIVTNTGEQTGTYSVVLMINNLVTDTRDVTLRMGESKTVTFTVSEDVAGTYNVVIDKLNGSFIVEAAEEPTEVPVEPITPEPRPVNWWIIAGSIVLGVAIVVVTGWFIITRREKI